MFLGTCDISEIILHASIRNYVKPGKNRGRNKEFLGWGGEEIRVFGQNILIFTGKIAFFA